MVMQAKKSIGEVLVERGVITEEQLQQAREVQKSAPGDLGADHSGSSDLLRKKMSRRPARQRWGCSSWT